MLTRDANVSSVTTCEQPDVVEETEARRWALSAGLSAVGRGHRAGLTGCLLLAAFSGRKKTGSDSLCLSRMPNQPWWAWLLTFLSPSARRLIALPPHLGPFPACLIWIPNMQHTDCHSVTPPGWQAAAEEICVWEDGDPMVRDQAGAISQGETLPGSTIEGSDTIHFPPITYQSYISSPPHCTVPSLQFCCTIAGMFSHLLPLYLIPFT